MDKSNADPRLKVCIDENGEFFVSVQAKTKVPPFQRVDAAMLTSIPMSKDMTLTEYRLLLYVLGTMDINNVCWDTCSRLAEVLEIAQPTLSRTISSLVDRGYLTRCAWSGRGFHLMVNPSLATRCREQAVSGLVAIWEAALKEAATRGAQPQADSLSEAADKTRFTGLNTLKKSPRARIAKAKVPVTP